MEDGKWFGSPSSLIYTIFVQLSPKIQSLLRKPAVSENLVAVSDDSVNLKKVVGERYRCSGSAIKVKIEVVS